LLEQAYRGLSEVLGPEDQYSAVREMLWPSYGNWMSTESNGQYPKTLTPVGIVLGLPICIGWHLHWCIWRRGAVLNIPSLLFLIMLLLDS